MFDSPFQDQKFLAWREQTLSSSKVVVRRANPNTRDARWMRWIQAGCESTFIHSIEDNRLKIEKERVDLAEIGGVTVGFCVSRSGREASDPLFVQLVAVVPWARQRGAGLALLAAAASTHPQRNIALATLEDNLPAKALNLLFAESIGANIKRVPLRRYRRSDLGFALGELYRPWVIERQPPARP